MHEINLNSIEVKISEIYKYSEPVRKTNQYIALFILIFCIAGNSFAQDDFYPDSDTENDKNETLFTDSNVSNEEIYLTERDFNELEYDRTSKDSVSTRNNEVEVNQKEQAMKEKRGDWAEEMIITVASVAIELVFILSGAWLW